MLFKNRKSLLVAVCVVIALFYQSINSTGTIRASVEVPSQQVTESTKKEQVISNEDTINEVASTSAPQKKSEIEKKEVPVVEEKTIILQIPEGFKLVELASHLETNGFGTKEQFLEVANDRSLYDSLKSKYPSLLPEVKDGIHYLFEGYLYADTYEIKESATHSEIIEMMVERMNSVMQELESKFPYHYDMNYSEILTLASVVQKESSHSDDRRNIAGAFINRIEQGMPLQSDVTVLYAHNRDGGRVLYSDLEIASPYNTYHVDFPIGPINTPDRNAIVSVFNAYNNDYLFFFGTGTRTVFTSSFEEHKQVIAQYTN